MGHQCDEAVPFALAEVVSGLAESAGSYRPGDVAAGEHDALPGNRFAFEHIARCWASGYCRPMLLLPSSCTVFIPIFSSTQFCCTARLPQCERSFPATEGTKDPTTSEEKAITRDWNSVLPSPLVGGL